LGQDAFLPLQLTGVRDGAIVKRLPGSPEVSVPVQTSGGTGERWWFLNGERLDERGRNLTLRLTVKGEYQLLVMDAGGQVATVRFALQ
jgi:penicillin-binding protein 1C